MEKKAWAVIGNTDLTEGRGKSFVISFHWLKASALRAAKKKYVMGSDAPIDEVVLYQHGSGWYGPVTVEGPTAEDERSQQHLDKLEAVIAKAKQLGLNTEDLKILGHLA